MQPEGLIAVGRLTKPHGLRGELVFLPYVYDVELLPDLVQQQVFLQQGHAPVQTATILEWRVASKRVLVWLHGCKDIATAEAKLNADKVRLWLSRGAQPSDPVRHLLARAGLLHASQELGTSDAGTP